MVNQQKGGVAKTRLVAAAVATLIVGVAPIGDGLFAQEGGDFSPLPIDLLLDVHSDLGGETPTWSPDGEKLLVASSGGLAMLDPSTGMSQRVPATLGSSGHFFAGQDPRWPPDGRWIPYVSAESGTPELWLWSTGEGTRR